VDNFFKNLINIRKRSRPISRVLSRTTIHLERTSPSASSDLPEPGTGRTDGFLFGLAPSGVCPANPVTGIAVRSYRTFSPLPTGQGQVRRCIFCGTFHRLTPSRRYLAPCPSEPGLSSMEHHPRQMADGQTSTPRLSGRLHGRR